MMTLKLFSGQQHNAFYSNIFAEFYQYIIRHRQNSGTAPSGWTDRTPNGAPLAIHPGQKAIIVSGFSETERVHAAQFLGAGSYVRKPYFIEKLGLAVRKELDRPPKIKKD